MEDDIVTSPGGNAVPAIDGSERFPELARLFGTHLVESWRSMYGSTVEALRDGFDDRSVDELRAVLTELNDLLGLRLGEPGLRDVLYYDLGSHYSPADRTCTDWLEGVVSEVHEAVKARTTVSGSANPMAEEP
jgi:CdiI immunity protein